MNSLPFLTQLRNWAAQQMMWHWAKCQALNRISVPVNRKQLVLLWHWQASCYLHIISLCTYVHYSTEVCTLGQTFICSITALRWLLFHSHLHELQHSFKAVIPQYNCLVCPTRCKQFPCTQCKSEVHYLCISHYMRRIVQHTIIRKCNTVHRVPVPTQCSQKASIRTSGIVHLKSKVAYMDWCT